MKLLKTDLVDIDKRQFREMIGLGYCKVCREWDVLSLPKRICFDCLGFQLTQSFKRTPSGFFELLDCLSDSILHFKF